MGVSMSQKKTTVAHIYNPANQSEQELIANFVVRQREFQTLLKAVKTAPMQFPEQDYIIQGPRGSGKTTLLLRLYYEIKNDGELNKRLIPVIFSEEQYFIRSLDRLWEAVIEEINKTDAGKVCEPSQHYLDEEEHNFQNLTTTLHQQYKKAILLIDNIGDMFDKFTELEQRRLRERLLTSADIRIIGASSKILEHTYDYSKPFFDFFDMTYLKGLSAEETDQLLLRLSQTYNESAVADIVKNQRGRVETLRRLTGGIPRTIILLFEIFAEEHNGDSFRDLEAVLDRVTPLYKHRMDDLSPMQQELVDAIALNWDAMTFEEIAAKVRMDSETVQDQLEKLVKNRIVDIVPTPAKVLLYQIAERFFNIWYLMRYGRRGDKNRVIWLVRFLQDWCSQEELVGRAKKLMVAIDTGDYHPRHAFYMTEALVQTELHEDLKYQLHEKTKAFLALTDQNLLKELSPFDRKLFEEATTEYEKGNLASALQKLRKIKHTLGFVNLFIGHVYSAFEKYKQAEKHYLRAFEKGEAEGALYLAYLYKSNLKNYEKAKMYYLKAGEYGCADAFYSLGFWYDNEFKDYEQAEIYYLKAAEQGHVQAMFILAHEFYNYVKRKVDRTYVEAKTPEGGRRLYLKAKDSAKAEKYYLKAFEHGHIESLYCLANLYDREGKYLEAEKYYLMAIEHGYKRAISSLASLYEKCQEYTKAETYYLKALETESENPRYAMGSLARLYHEKLGDYQKAENYYLKAIELSDIDATRLKVDMKYQRAMYMYNLARLYHEKLNDYVEAETYYLKTIELDNHVIGAMSMENLAWLYHKKLNDYKKSETYYLKAIALDPHIQETYNRLALLYHEHLNEYKKAEEYYLKALEMGDNIVIPNNLAILYHDQLHDYGKAEKYYLRAIEYGDKMIAELTNSQDESSLEWFKHECAKTMCNLANLYETEYKDYDKAITYYLKAIEHNYEKAILRLIWVAVRHKLYETQIVNMTKEIFDQEKDVEIGILFSILLLLDHQTQKAITIFSEILSHLESFERYNQAIEAYLKILILNKLYDHANSLFQDKRFDFKERYKPVYYALMYFMQEKFPNEYFKMGEELKETVEEIIEQIRQWRKEYT